MSNSDRHGRRSVSFAERHSAPGEDPTPPPVLTAQERAKIFSTTSFHYRENMRGVSILIVVLVILGAAFGAVISQMKSPPASKPAAAPVQTQALGSSLANFMGLAPVPGHHLAPNFTLTSQSNTPFTLSSLRGKAVVLTFMDAKCTDICPIVSQEMVDAYKDLGPKAANVAFVAVNANPVATSVTDVASFSSAHGLTAIPSWRFVTGSLQQLNPVWKAYGVAVQYSQKTGVVIHSDQVYFIGPNGHERYLATPYANQLPNGTATLAPASISRWGSGVAHYAGLLAK